MPIRPVLLLVLLTLAVAGRAEPVRVVVGVAPLQGFVERIGGQHTAVSSLLRPGDDPHHYDPSARQIAGLSGTRLFVGSGMPFERLWLQRARAANPAMRILGPGASEEAGHGQDDHHGDADYDRHEDGHGHGHGIDPHLWTSPSEARRMGREIRDALLALDPANAPDYERNHAAFQADMDTLDRDIRERLAGLQQRRFLVYHPAWGHFARSYDLTQIAIEVDGREPSAKALAGTIEQARKDGIRTVFVQPQINSRAAQQVAEALGGRVQIIDPLASDYDANLRRVAELIAAAGRP